MVGFLLRARAISDKSICLNKWYRSLGVDFRLIVCYIEFGHKKKGAVSNSLLVPTKNKMYLTITPSEAALSEHPPSITGAILQTSIDYLRVILPISRSEYTLQALELMLRDYFSCALSFEDDKPYFCGRYFSHGHRNSDDTCIVGYNWDKGEGHNTGELILNISGQLLSRCSFPRLSEFCTHLYQLGAHCSRIDISVDDFSKEYFDYDKLCSAIDSHNFTGARLDNASQSTNAKGGWIVTMGSRANGKYARWYNKFIESKGKINSYRYEVEYKGGYAKSIFESFCTFDLEDDEVRLEFISKLLGGAFSFIDRSESSNVSRCGLLPWWQKFLNALGGALQWSVPRVQKSLDKTITWIEKQVIKSLVVIKKCLGDAKYNNWFDYKFAQLSKKLNPSQVNRIDNYELETALQLSLELGNLDGWQSI